MWIATRNPFYFCNVTSDWNNIHNIQENKCKVGLDWMVKRRTLHTRMEPVWLWMCIWNNLNHSQHKQDYESKYNPFWFHVGFNAGSPSRYLSGLYFSGETSRFCWRVVSKRIQEVQPVHCVADRVTALEESAVIEVRHNTEVMTCCLH